MELLVYLLVVATFHLQINVKTAMRWKVDVSIQANIHS